MTPAETVDIKQLLSRVRELSRTMRSPTGSIERSETEVKMLGRLDASVIRPLAELLGGEAEEASTSSGAGSPPASVWELAQHATLLRRNSTAPSGLIEATAALQDLACASSPDDATLAERLATLGRLHEGLEREIRPSRNGPLLVTNVEDLTNWLGEPLPTRPQLALCRCGASATKPYCDGSHATNGFVDAKDPKRILDRADTYVGQQLTIIDNRGTCQHSGFCTDRLSTVFRTKEEPFVAPSGGRMDEIVRAVRDCPSGALSYAIDGVAARADVDWHGTRGVGIEVSKDGPYRISGGIALRDEAGADVPRNAEASQEHYALCRCGHAQNKPFCTGMHWYVEFHDPKKPLDRTPSVFEWAGGLPALTRMTRLFYEKLIPADEILAPVFARMSADHPQRVAKWLGEVFGGPRRYSEDHGGYPQMLSQHLGKHITEEMRARWVTLLLQAAHEAGLPNDPEFRSTFQAYIEWGSRLAVENSQTASHPPLHMPMPHWDWSTSAGPPGSRISALAPSEAASDEKPLPLPDETLEFDKHIKGLFRERDRKSMQFAFDLWSHADVSKHAEAILERLQNGSMPCDGAWKPEKIAVFARWISAGKAA